jgi:REase_MTES_1575/Protein of unknown function (DUF4011)/AAA domain/Protein of unknown function (DUF3320)
VPDGTFELLDEYKFRQAICKWRDGLINLTGSNRLLNFKPSKTGMLSVVSPSPEEVLSRISRGKACSFRPLKPRGAEAEDDETPYEPPPPSADSLDIGKDPDELGAALRALHRRSNQAFLDQGLSVLYLAFGSLAWTDADRTRYTSPLLLVPVRLVPASNRQFPALEPTDDDTVINPALALKLVEYGVQLPRVDDVEEISLPGLLAMVRTAVAGHREWEVSETLVLSCFSFAKEAMYRDLLDNEDRITVHQGIAALAGVSNAELSERMSFDEIPDSEIDERAIPEDTPVILDADSSQRSCIAAALEGRSFVMDGPPGTGKSQTIANMIGVLLYAGKTVLFVSEKAAALDVVRDRLDSAGLRPFLLELHSHKATRKQVAIELGQALARELVPPEPMLAVDVYSVRRRREELNAYADAMNCPRGQLGSSLHEVLGMIAQLNAVPVAPATGLAPIDLTAETFGEIKRTAAKIAAAWRPARQGRSFVWRGVTHEGSLEACLSRAASTRETLAGLSGINATLAAATGLTRPSDAAALAGLLGHLACRPPGLPDDWLTTGMLSAVNDATSRLAGRLDEISLRENAVGQAAGVPWTIVPRASSLAAEADAALDDLIQAGVDVADLRAEQVTALRRTFTAEANGLESRIGSLSGLAGLLGLHTPQTFNEADDLLSVALLAQAPDLPESTWLSLEGLATARQAAGSLDSAQQVLVKAEIDSAVYYTAMALDEDVDALARRFTTDHHGLGKLSGEYRADKKRVAGFTREGIDKETAHQHLGLAIAWKQAVAALRSAEQAHAPVLGTYYTGRSTDWERLRRALSVADTAVRRVRGQDMSQVADYLARDRSHILATTGVARDITRDLTAWQSRLGARASDLLGGTIRDAVSWQRSKCGPLDAVAAFTEAVSQAIGRGLTCSQARHLARLRGEADVAHERLAACAADFGDTFGELYDGPRTDVATIRQALEWARSLRARVTGTDASLTPEQIKAVRAAVPTGNLAAASAAWNDASEALAGAFDADRRQELAPELDDYNEAADLIKELLRDTGGKDEWHAYQAARENLGAYGLAVAVDFCVGERVPSEQVPQVIERAILREWAEYQLRTDPALSVVRAEDRNALVAEYQKLDRALITAATGTIIRACNARRPRTDAGESTVILREAGKKKRHMPVRTLIERSRNVTQAIKPCFMMSPLAVSQFLPPDMHFDVVIFDEASQVSPGDAINCIYRGSALILAGDQKQLPPTSFFAASGPDDGDEWSEDTDDTADFESVLDLAKGAGVFRNLTLRWHYRSRHEALIAFSNASFYEGKLVTFPSRQSDGPDVGVSFFGVDGTYRRGSSRDNPVEAARVAERVIHHYDTRPTMSLGVVTFSEAQAVAIETAVRDARRDRPDLDRFFETNDRLTGFFVKNLESVQGDERDVLIFSVGYGPDENRKLTMNFGPLNKQGGWRRLNVAITRAHYRNEVVSSIHAGDISGAITSEGVRHLRRYLDYAVRGMPALALSTDAGGDAESPFEESVIAVIRSWGYEITPQVGTAGYRIDIGVRHPDHPGAFALGVECDGYQYHSSRVARDRDRLREQVLLDLGWRLHRIWGTAWYRDRNGEERKLRAAVEEAIAAPVHGLLTGSNARSASADRVTLETKSATFEQVPSWAKQYVIAGVPSLPGWLDPSEPSSCPYMADAIRVVVQIENPIHVSLLDERLRIAWDIGRIGPRIRANINAAISLANVLRNGDFFTMPGPIPAIVRTPTPQCRREIGQVHNHELGLALIALISDAGGVGRDELTTRVARLFGWARRGPDVTSRMDILIDVLLEHGNLAGTDDNLTLPRATP